MQRKIKSNNWNVNKALYGFGDNERFIQAGGGK